MAVPSRECVSYSIHQRLVRCLTLHVQLRADEIERAKRAHYGPLDCCNVLLDTDTRAILVSETNTAMRWRV